MKKANLIVSGPSGTTTVIPAGDIAPAIAESTGLFSFILRDQNNRKYFFIALIGLVIQFMLFKVLYPFPDFFSDSYSYLFAAYAHLDVNIWPIGYSRFLYSFHQLTHSGMALVAFQYFFLELSAIYFFFSLLYIYNLGKTTKIILFIFLFFNPLYLYIGNYVTSDAIFGGLSLIWITQLIWIIHRPRLYQIFLQAAVIFIAFTFRYNAMIYPLISAFALIMSRQKAWIKATGIFLAPVLIIPFIIFSRDAAKEMTGTPQFPPILGGWQWANNALYMREFIDVDSTKLPSPECAELDRLARKFFRETPPAERDLPAYVANFFIRQPNAPLKQYMMAHYKINDELGEVVAWGKCAPVFGQYGLYLTKGHPFAFARHYMLVNTKNYFLPPLEKLEVYNLGLDEYWPMAQYWFDMQKEAKSYLPKTFQGTLLSLYPVLFMILNIYFAGAFIWLLTKQGFQNAGNDLTRTILVISSFLLLNFGFSVFANIIVIRYQVFPMMLFVAFSLILIELVEQVELQRKKKQFEVESPRA
jgi:hypothetical protein